MLPNTAPHSRWKHFALAAMFFLVGIGITYIVSNGHKEATIEMKKMKSVADDLVFVFEAISEPGEEIDPFVLRVAPKLAEFTKQSGREACGFVAKDAQEDLLGVRFYTSGGAMTCMLIRSLVPDGMFALRTSIHSHPERSVVMPTMADMKYYQDNPMASGRAIVRGRPEQVGGRTFSDADYAVGPGYVVARGEVHHQAGKGTERLVATLAN